MIIAREAGAVVIDHDGSAHRANSTATIAAAPGVAEQIGALIGQTLDGLAIA